MAALQSKERGREGYNLVEMADTPKPTDELSELRAFKAILMKSLSHDVRNPLGNVLSTVESLYETLGAGTSAQALAGIALSGARGAMRIVTTLVFWSKLKAGAYCFDPGVIEAAGLMAATLDTLKPLAEANGQTLASAVAPGCPAFLADAPLLYCVLENLAVYAMKFAPRGGRVEISIRPRPADRAVEIRVTDNGPAISPGARATLFDIEAAAELPASGVRGPFGPGLAFAAVAATALGGSLALESPIGAPGGDSDSGAAFILTLPLQR